MVEGPQCHLKAEAIAAKFTGKAVVAAVGSALPPGGLARLSGCVLQRVVAVGKECLVVFLEFVLRLHFGMAGGHRVRAVDSAPSDESAGRKQLVLSLEFCTEQTVDIFDSTSSVHTLAYLQTLEARASRDIVAPPHTFDRADVVQRLRTGECSSSCCSNIVQLRILSLAHR